MGGPFIQNTNATQSYPGVSAINKVPRGVYD
jgi:hypothetical protein